MKSGDERWAVKLPDGGWHPNTFDDKSDAYSMAATYRHFGGIEATVVRVRVTIEEIKSEGRGE